MLKGNDIQSLEGIAEMKQKNIKRFYFLMHPFCYAIYEDKGEPFLSDPPFFHNGGFERYLEYERTIRARWNDAISTLEAEDALVIVPVGSFQSQQDLEHLAKQVLGPRCVILNTNPFDSADFRGEVEPEFKIGVADDLMVAFRSRGCEWRVQDMKVAVDSRIYAREILAAFRQRGLTFDPATVCSEAWGESFEGCVTKWSNGIGTYLKLSRPIEKNFELTVPDAPFLLRAKFLEQVTVRDNVRLFLFEGADSRPIGLFLKTMHSVWNRPLVAQLPAECAVFEVRKKSNELVWPGDEGSHQVTEIVVEVPIYGGSYSDDPTYIFGQGLTAAKFRERLLGLQIVEK